LLGAIPFYGVHFWLVSQVNQRRRIRLSDKFVSVFVAITLSTGLLGVYFFDRENTASILILIVGLLATAGWMYTNYISIKNASTNHTMNVLMQMRNSTELNKHRANIVSLIPVNYKLDDSHLKIIKTEKICGKYNPEISLDESIRYVLNYYEFICAGVNLNHLNERLIRNTMRSIFVNFQDMVEVFIHDARKDDFGRENPRIFQHFIEVVARFRDGEKPEDLMSDFQLPSVRDRPRTSRNRLRPGGRVHGPKIGKRLMA